MQKSVFSCIWPTLLLVALSDCKTRDLSCFEKTPLDETQLPPNCVRLQENLFIDKTEISNIDYREYLYWMEKVYGYNSFIYKQCLPDTLVWQETIQYGEPLVVSYLRHPAYDIYPMVGVSYDQAVAFCDWRTDRVYEMMLVRKKRIEYDPTQDSIGHFTAARYQDGQYRGYAPDLSVPVPRFRLPTESEWELAASGRMDPKQYPQGYDFDTRQMKKMSKRHPYLFNTNEKSLSHPNTTKDFIPNNFGIFNIIGNVAEMISERGLAKGGSYVHPTGECVITNKFTYEKATRWLGFRCICSWEQAD